MGQGYNTPNPSQTTAESLQAYIKYLPQLLNVTSKQIPSIAQTVQNTEQNVAPQAQNLQTQLYSSSAPDLYKIGNVLSGITNTGGVTNALNTYNSPAGQQLESAAISADQAANPQFYAARAAAGNQLTNLLGSINLNGLTGSENAQISRALAQQDAQKGIIASPSQTATVANAMQFGTALQQKQANLAAAINTATSFLPSSKSGVNAFAVGTGAATNPGSNPGSSQFLGTTNSATNAGTNAASSAGSNLLSNITQQQNNANSLISAQNINSSIPSLMSSVPT